MNNEVIDIGLLAAKVATLNNEKARIATSGVSLVYNAVQYANFNSLVAEYPQILSTITFRARLYGYQLHKLSWQNNVMRVFNSANNK